VATGVVKLVTDLGSIQAAGLLFSPDGKKIAFTGRTTDPDPPITHIDIYVMNADGTKLKKMTNHTIELMPERSLGWSPDSKKIVYDLMTVMVDDITDYQDIFVLDVATGREVNLTDTENIIETDSCWSPDGKKIAFSAMSGNDLPYGTYIMDNNGRDLFKVADSTFSASWLPGGRSLIAIRWEPDMQLWYSLLIVDLNKQITMTLFQSGEKYVSIGAPVWLGK
jgi:Tol biopolymer transport system component